MFGRENLIWEYAKAFSDDTVYDKWDVDRVMDAMEKKIEELEIKYKNANINYWRIINLGRLLNNRIRRFEHENEKLKTEIQKKKALHDNSLDGKFMSGRENLSYEYSEWIGVNSKVYYMDQVDEILDKMEARIKELEAENEKLKVQISK